MRIVTDFTGKMVHPLPGQQALVDLRHPAAAPHDGPLVTGGRSEPCLFEHLQPVVETSYPTRHLTIIQPSPAAAAAAAAAATGAALCLVNPGPLCPLPTQVQHVLATHCVAVHRLVLTQYSHPCSHPWSSAAVLTVLGNRAGVESWHRPPNNLQSLQVVSCWPPNRVP